MSILSSTAIAPFTVEGTKLGLKFQTSPKSLEAHLIESFASESANESDHKIKWIHPTKHTHLLQVLHNSRIMIK
jgi:hypothetical protein